ncbi:MAG: lipopolysaccharide assembly protein LapB [Chromatiales bacterium]|nr:lipopolysaccharide assembly protein LapB [Chromatiales bacterium]
MPLENLLFLLLPIAAFSGWLVGIRRERSKAASKAGYLSLSQGYFKGLNYLLNEQSDKALEVFVQMSEVDSETVDLHFALASLFARRGEVERAIRIHQNLIARPVLTQRDRNRALYELAGDYMRAGLLDRAESLYSELVDDAEYGQLSRRQLLDVYQQEKEWDKAIAIARRLDTIRGQPLSPTLAHFYCELADAALARGDATLAMQNVKRAFSEDKNSVRATLTEARFYLLSKNSRAAIKSLKRVEKQNSDYLPLILDPMQQAYVMEGNSAGFVDYLRELSNGASISTVLTLSNLLQQQEGDDAALKLLSQIMQQRPSLRLLQQMLLLYTRRHAESRELKLALDTLEKYMHDKPFYHCTNCGFQSRNMQWQCPSCKQWDRVRPIHGIDGD